MLNRRSLLEQLSLAGLAAGTAGLHGPAAGQPAASSSGSPLAQGLPGVVLQAGRHEVNANLTVRADVLAMPGATIHVAAGRTLTLLGDFQAPVGRVFTGEGRVDMNRGRAPAAHPEWWGAGRDDGAVDSLPALRACVAAHPVTLLGAGDYFIGDTWRIDLPHRRIWGAGSYWHGPNQGTRIVVTSATADAIRIGSARQPGAINDYLQSVDLRWLEASRSVAPRGEAAGVRLAHVLHSQVEGVRASEHVAGFAVAGAVRTILRDCLAFRSLQGERRFRGFHLDGRADIGLAGGNASVTLVDCNASVGGPPDLAESVGALLEGGFADTALHRFETGALATGIRIDGRRDAISAKQRRFGQANVHIVSPVLDGFSFAGIELTGGGSHAVVDILDAYCGLAPAALAGVHVHDWEGMVTLTGGQMIGWFNAVGGGDGRGVHAVNAAGLGLHGVKLLGCRRPVTLDRCRDFTIDVLVTNPDEPASSAALWVENCQRGSIRASVRGGRDAFHQGVYLRGANRALAVDCTGIDPASLRAGGERRLVTDGGLNALRGNAVTVTGL